MNVNSIRVAISEALDGLDLNVYSYWPDNPSAPCVVIAPQTIEYGQAFGGASRATFNVTVVSGLVADANAQEIVDGWISDDASTSVAGLLMAASASTLAGSLETVRLASYGPISLGDVRYLGAQFDVAVYA